VSPALVGQHSPVNPSPLHFGWAEQEAFPLEDVDEEEDFAGSFMGAVAGSVTGVCPLVLTAMEEEEEDDDDDEVVGAGGSADEVGEGAVATTVSPGAFCPEGPG